MTVKRAKPFDRSNTTITELTSTVPQSISDGEVPSGRARWISIIKSKQHQKNNPSTTCTIQ